MQTINIGEFEIKKRGRNDGYAVKCIRGLRNLKREELAKMIKVSDKIMQNIENKEFIEDTNLIKIAAALKVRIDFITNFHKECEISIYNDHAKKFEDSSVNNEHFGVPVSDYKLLVNTTIELKDIIQEKELRIKELLQQIESLKNS